MSNNDLSIEKVSLEDTILKIDTDISELTRLLDETLKGYETLDESKWKGPEKTKMDEQFWPYLKKVSVKYPELLTDRSTFLKNALSTHENLDKQIQEATDELI